MTRLILNADDFGLAPGVNQSVLELGRREVLTSTTLMATASYMAAAAAGAATLPTLGVGCHVVLVDGTPALPPKSIPGLTRHSTRFRPNLVGFLRDLARGGIPESEIEAETIAQIRRVQAAGISITHLDAHKHTHMFPRVLRPLLRAARVCGVGAIRNPFEPSWSVRATPRAPFARMIEVRLLSLLRHRFMTLVHQAGLITTDGALGVLATGTLNEHTVESLLATIPRNADGTWELVCHPGFHDEELDRVRTRLRESRAVEHAALLAAVPRFLAARPDVRLVHFGQLPGNVL